MNPILIIGIGTYPVQVLQRTYKSPLDDHRGRTETRGGQAPRFQHTRHCSTQARPLRRRT